jgi:hypothetical protein
MTPMIFKYQVILLGTLTKLSEDIVKLLFLQIEELRLPRKAYKIIYESNLEQEYKGNQPTYVLYFGDSGGDHKDVKYVEKLLKDGNAVLPIFYDSFSKEIPEILGNQNGLKFHESKRLTVVNLILESFGKLRSTRKVFISYRRDQSSSVAIQLYEALERANFDVFLDTHSIKQGEPFQDELWHRMTDSDVIVLLNTSKFLESRWCKEEIAESSAKKIGVIQLVWPDHVLESMAEICFPRQLTKHDFKDDKYDDKDVSKLVDSTIKEIITQVESVRARNLASRQDELITNFLNIARMRGKKVNLQPERFITENIAGQKMRIFIPLVGIPQSTNCEQSSALKSIKDFQVDKILLIYDDLRIRDKWLKHLDYLNAHLDVQTLKMKNFDIWLQSN